MRFQLSFMLGIVFLLPAFLMFVAPIGVYAEPNTTGLPLVPCTGPDCQACDLVTLAQNIITWLIGFGVLLGVVFIAWAGFKLVISGGNIEAKSDAKSMVWKVVIGFSIMLAAWLVVDAGVKVLTGKGIDQYKIECTENPEVNRSGKSDMLPYIDRSGKSDMPKQEVDRSGKSDLIETDI